jgi:hypothetical protein
LGCLLLGVLDGELNLRTLGEWEWWVPSKNSVLSVRQKSIDFSAFSPEFQISE